MALRRRTMAAPRRIKALQMLPLSREYAAPLGQGTRPTRLLSPAGNSLQACSQPGLGIHRQWNGRDWGMLDPRRPPPGASNPNYHHRTPTQKSPKYQTKSAGSQALGAPNQVGWRGSFCRRRRCCRLPGQKARVEVAPLFTDAADAANRLLVCLCCFNSGPNPPGE